MRSRGTSASAPPPEARWRSVRKSALVAALGLATGASGACDGGSFNAPTPAAPAEASTTVDVFDSSTTDGTAIYIPAPSESDASAALESGIPIDGAPLESEADQAAMSCDLDAGDPSTESCLVSETYGVFVASSGSDEGDGSREHPFATIGFAMAHLSGKTRLFICDGSYREQVTIQSNPVSLYGGLSCADGWVWDGGETDVLSPSDGDALSIADLDNATPIEVEDLTFTVPDATSASDGGASPDDSGSNSNAGASSIAVIVANSAVRLTRVALVAGAGADGADGQPGTANFGSADSLIPSATGMGLTNVCRYMNDSSTGGSGEDAYGVDAGLFTQLGAGTSNPTIAPALMVAGHDGAPSNGTGPGDPGADGPPRSAASGPAAYGNVSESPLTWNPTAGGDGPAGQPGQGGGGGLALVHKGIAVQVGGAGGAGGCGGAGGTGGQGGGGSIALLAWNSTVTLSSSTVQTAAGGHGGRGGDGVAGQGGGAGYVVDSTLVWLNGGSGGNGAGGSGGQGGAAGVSAAIVYGPAGAPVPTYDASTRFVLPTGPRAVAGSGGEGGSPATVGLADAGLEAGVGSTNAGPAGPTGFQAAAAVVPIVKVLPPPWDGTHAVL
jgi:hypothetical protein